MSSRWITPLRGSRPESTAKMRTRETGLEAIADATTGCHRSDDPAGIPFGTPSLDARVAAGTYSLVSSLYRNWKPDTTWRLRRVRLTIWRSV